ncbi:hypothetical protein J5X84_26810 [Streptosporangiaceae bacterium NEAU-GS5]|nr:hypothetical protein [Streptosporangiaceae bacterium NEAU-GS5]
MSLSPRIPRLALVGDRSAAVRAHTRVPLILDALSERYDIDLDAYWIPTPQAYDLEGFDGIWVLPGSPYAGRQGALNAARTARTHRIPFLGTCGGFQHALLDFARDVCGLDVAHGESDPDAPALLLRPLACTLAGHEGKVRLTPGSLLSSIAGAETMTARYHCSFGLNPDYLDVLEAHGLRFTAHDFASPGDAAEVRAAELPGHPFFVGTLFQPELDEDVPHPIIRAFADSMGKLCT